MYDEEISEEVKKEYFEMNLKAAEIGFVEVMGEIAGMYLEGVGVEKNFDEAVKWYEKAFGEGDSSVAVTLGRIYREKNIEKSIFYLSKAAEKNNIEAIKELAEIYESRSEFEKMFECCQRGANLGSGDLMREVADCYLFGRGVQQDDLKALEWYIKVVELYGWDNNDMRLVTKIYNKHFKFSDEKFLKYYVTTEKLGHFNAMFGIATELYKTDKYRALKWYKMAANAGDYDAAVAVSDIIEELLYGAADIWWEYSAHKWYEKAVEFGNVNAAKNLAIMDFAGFGRRVCGGYLPNVEKSLCWLKKVLKVEEKDENKRTGIYAQREERGNNQQL